MTMKYLVGAVCAVAAVAGVLAAPAAQAEPPCAAYDTCKYMPNPNYDGPLMDTWNVPGTYGGWTTNPLICDPITRECRQAVPGM